MGTVFALFRAFAFAFAFGFDLAGRGLALPVDFRREAFLGPFLGGMM